MSTKVVRVPHAESMTCISCGVPATARGLDHSHIQPRSQRPDLVDDPANQVLQCRAEHFLIEAKKARHHLSFEAGAAMLYVYELWNDEKADFEEITRVIVVVDKKRRHLVPALSDSAEAESPVLREQSGKYTSALSPSAGRAEAGDILTDGSPPVSALKEESDGFVRTGHDSRDGARRVDSSPSSPRNLTHEQRVAIAQQIKDTEWNRQWIAGDTGNAWIAELGEEAEQYLSDFGYVQESLANILRVCAAIPPQFRNKNLRYSHHVVVAKLNREEMEMWLGECEENQWSVATFREKVHGPPNRTKRWPMSELLEGVEDWPHPTDRPRPKGAVRVFLTWLGEQ